MKTLAVLDRTKEPGCVGEPLYQDVVTSLSEAVAAGQSQFKSMPRIIGGRYPEPHVLHPYRRCFPGICPTITATEYKASGATDKCRASRFYGRNLTVEECAWHQGLTIPRAWYGIPEWFWPDDRFRGIHWRRNLYVAIGNAVPVYMARAFGAALLHHGQAH